MEGEKFKYDFITIIAHKFRTPLTQIKWILDDMRDDPDPHRRENFVRIRSSNEKLINLTGTLIELTNLNRERKELYSFETVPICDFVKTVADAHKDYFHEKNIFLSINCSDPDTKVSIDRRRMEFVLQTLLENARIYTPPGRNVDVAVGKIAGRAVVVVSDHGIGIDSSDLPKVFTKFYRADNARKTDTEGFGVGLFLAQTIVREHHGRITADSAGADQGSTFTITLPIKK